jgi:triosephosphate isomerase
MFKTQKEIKDFCESFNHLLNNDHKLKSANTVVGIAPTYLGLSAFKANDKTSTTIMAQNANAEINGAYTSEISYSQLKDLGVTTVLIGHSEVRSHLHESDTLINKKVLTLLKENMVPVLCIGETLQEFEQGKTDTILEKQLTANLLNIDPSTVKCLIIAYEPIWAIGTGKTATIDVIEKTFVAIKNILSRLLPTDAHNIALLYGGSVNEKNAVDILKVANVNGVLVGGASLDPQKFYTIIKSTPEYQKGQ